MAEQVWRVRTTVQQDSHKHNVGVKIFAEHVDGEKRLTKEQIEQWLADLEQARYHIADLEAVMLEAGLELGRLI